MNYWEMYLVLNVDSENVFTDNEIPILFFCSIFSFPFGKIISHLGTKDSVSSSFSTKVEFNKHILEKYFEIKIDQ